MLERLIKDDEQEHPNIEFSLKNDLIFHIKNEKKRLCISFSCERDIFKLAHDQNNHFDHHRVYFKLIDQIFILKLFRKIRLYIKHCSACELNQIKRHSTYEELTFMNDEISFRIIVMNFILALSKEMNVALTIICKAFKEITIISEKSI